VALDRQGGKDRVCERQPEDDRRHQENAGDRPAVGDHDHLAAEDAGGGDRRQESGAAPVVCEVADQGRAVAHQAKPREQPEDEVGADVEREHGVRQPSDAEQLGGDRDDPGRHHQR
jgi:hypothetical protein